MAIFEDHLPGMLSFLKQLVECESPSHDKFAVDQAAELITTWCTAIGGRMETIPGSRTGDLHIARFGPETDQKKILLLCHMDTVYPLGTLAKMPYVEEGDRILGPGVADMKAGLVIGVTAITILQEMAKLPPCPITILFTPDEEIGSYFSRPWIEKLALQSKLVLVLEPGMPDGSIKTWRKGVGEFHVVARGQAAHSGGNHENGRNAIEELAHQVLELQSMTDYEHGTTLNVGVIQGGTVVNVVPDKAWLDVDLRVMQPGEAERITLAIQSLRPKLTGTTLEISGGLNRPPMPYDEKMHATFDHAHQIAWEHGINFTASGTGGASDGNFVAPLGIPILDGLGAIGGDYHSPAEYILKDSLVSRTQLLATLLTDW